MNYARRQQYRRIWRAGEAAFVATVLVVLGLGAASIGAGLLAAVLLVGAVGLGVYARHGFSLAGRSGVARSEEAVQRALVALEAEGWRLLHALRWAGRGDIDSVAIAPTGIAVAIETKTRSYDRGGHVARVHQQAAWLSRRRRSWARNGALAMMCVVRARGVEYVEGDVLVVSLDRLTRVLRIAAEMASARTR